MDFFYSVVSCKIDVYCGDNKRENFYFLWVVSCFKFVRVLMRILLGDIVVEVNVSLLVFFEFWIIVIVFL